jgi:hypothetical protein
MGDLRADIKIKMNLWGHNYKTDMWINYWDDGDGNDQRVKDFFAESYRDAYSKYQTFIYDSQAKERKASEKKAELAQLKRLKEKYESKGIGENI